MTATKTYWVLTIRLNSNCVRFGNEDGTTCQREEHATRFTDYDRAMRVAAKFMKQTAAGVKDVWPSQRDA